MKIPDNAAERHLFFMDLIGKCTATTETRREFYRQMRSYYLFGVSDRAAQDSRFNKILSHIETLISFMFSPETTRFTINLGGSVSAAEQTKVPPMVDRLHHEWHDSDIDAQFKQAVRWSAPYGKVCLKLRPKVFKRINHQKQIDKGLQIQAFVVEPHNMGVLREDKDGLMRQEAFTETFHISRSQLRNDLTAGGKSPSDVERILTEVQGGRRDDVLADASPVDRMIVTSIQGDSVTGNASMFPQTLQTLYRPTTKEDLIEGKELYVYDDKIADWRVVTYLQPNIPVFDRAIEDIFLAGHLPYVEVCINPTYDYHWGHSEVERLVPIQDLRNERMADIMHLLRKQAHPPNLITGTNAPGDELALAMDTPNGLGTVDSPAADLKKLVADLPADLWHDLTVIDGMFDEISGLTNVNQGKPAAGVRSEGHASMLSNLGSTRIRDRSLTVEDSLDHLAVLIVELLKRYDERPMREEDEHGEIFQAHQFPDDYEAKVDGHSNSPIFVENHEQKAFGLLDRKVIDREDLLDLIDIPMRAALKKKLRDKIEPGEQAAADREHQEKMAQIQAKRAHGGHGEPVGPQATAGLAPPSGTA
jgi:hypothetical protein